MDKFRRDLRDVFTRRQANLGDPEEASRRVLAAGLARRDRPDSGYVPLLAAVATVVISVLVVATFVYVRTAGHPGGSAASTARTTPTAAPSPSPAPHLNPAAGANTPATVIDADPVDRSTGFALVTDCGQGQAGPCGYFVVATYDGGDNWSAPVQIGAPVRSDDPSAPKKVLFVNGGWDGFVYGTSTAYVTHDGGQTWSPLGVTANVYDAIVASRSLVWVVYLPCPAVGSCQFQVRSSPDHGRSWSDPHALPANFDSAQAEAFGATGLLVAGNGAAGMTVTTDGGATWRRIGAQCVTYAEIDITWDGTNFLKDCIGQPFGTAIPQTVYVSTNGGRTWSQPSITMVGFLAPECSFPIVIVSTGAPGTAVGASVRCPIAITHDGGKSWFDAGPQGAAFIAFNFADPSDGWAVDSSHYIWMTQDGGQSWFEAGRAPKL